MITVWHPLENDIEHKINQIHANAIPLVTHTDWTLWFNQIDLRFYRISKDLKKVEVSTTPFEFWR